MQNKNTSFQKSTRKRESRKRPIPLRMAKAWGKLDGGLSLFGRLYCYRLCSSSLNKQQSMTLCFFTIKQKMWLSDTLIGGLNLCLLHSCKLKVKNRIKIVRSNVTETRWIRVIPAWKALEKATKQQMCRRHTSFPPDLFHKEIECVLSALVLVMLERNPLWWIHKYAFYPAGTIIKWKSSMRQGSASSETIGSP